MWNERDLYLSFCWYCKCCAFFCFFKVLKKKSLTCILFLKNTIQVPIVPYQGALDTAMATVCAVVPSVFAARALPAMIAVRCLAVMKKI